MEHDPIEVLRAEMQAREMLSEWRAAKRAFFAKPENADLDTKQVNLFLDTEAQTKALSEIHQHGRVVSSADEVLKNGVEALHAVARSRQTHKQAQNPKTTEAKAESRNMTNEEYAEVQRQHTARIRRPQL